MLPVPLIDAIANEEFHSRWNTEQEVGEVTTHLGKMDNEQTLTHTSLWHCVEIPNHHKKKSKKDSILKSIAFRCFSPPSHSAHLRLLHTFPLIALRLSSLLVARGLQEYDKPGSSQAPTPARISRSVR